MNRALLSPEQVDYLSKLPTRVDATLEGSRFHLAHAGPGGELYRFDITPKISDAFLPRALEGIEADFVFCGHTHLPMIRKIGRKTFANPDSVGLPLDRDPRVSYAVCYDSKVQLRPAKHGRQACRSHRIAHWTKLLHERLNVCTVSIGHGVAHIADRLMTPTVDDTVGASYEPTDRWVFYSLHPRPGDK